MEAKMTPKQAGRRYIMMMMSGSLGYLISVFGVSIFHDTFQDGSLAGITLSLIPAAFILIMIFSIYRFLNDMDEVARHDHSEAMLLSLFIILTLSGGWGLAELFNDSMPRLPVFFVFPIFFLIYGVISCMKYKRWA